MDETLRRQLIGARANIGTQLGQLEGTIVPGTEGDAPDSRNVYAELQRQLREIDTLLERDADNRPSDGAKPPYQPMVRWTADGTVGNETRPTRAGIIMAVVSVGMTPSLPQKTRNGRGR